MNTKHRNDRHAAWPGLALGALLLAGCAQVREPQALPAIQAELRQAARAPAAQALPPAVEAALLPQTPVELPKAAAQPLEPRFDLAVNDAPAAQVFLGIASGSRYSMLLHPEVSGNLTLNLKDVTVPEAMEAIRELYGYDYRIDGTRITVLPLTLQTRFYAIPYPAAVRKGSSEMRVISGAVTGASTGGSASAPEKLETSRLSTTLETDFWQELKKTVSLLIGCGATPAQAGAPAAPAPPACPGGRDVVASPHAGMLAVRALPAEQRQVADYLKAAKLTVERQVMIEAKIIEVTLNEGAQTGINWAYFYHDNHLSKGADASRFSLPKAVPDTDLDALLGGGLAAAGGAIPGSTAHAGVFGLALQTANFAALINFLETQGSVQVLSSPRIAALNNQKAVLKVGSDEFFVTNVSTTTTTGAVGGTGTVTPNVTLQPFFSGIALDVTPQIDEQDNIILHVHPSVSQVTTVTKNIDLGSDAGQLTLPLASSTVSETDSIVRLKDGQIAAIGGLMKRESRDAGSQVPGAGDLPVLGSLFRNSNASRTKQELVILLKPTLIRQPGDWIEGVREADARLAAPPPAPRP